MNPTQATLYGKAGPETTTATKPCNCADALARITDLLRALFTFFLAPFTAAWQRRQLLRELSRREIHASFNGSMLGISWLILQPLLTLVVYAAVFGGVLGLGRAAPDEPPMLFVSRLFTGMIVYQAFTATVSRAPRLVLSRPNYVTKVAFPLHLLPWPILALGAIHAAIASVLLLLVHAMFVGTPAWTCVLLPAVLAPVLLLGLGVSWVLASIGVYVRDMADITKVVIQLLFFISPVVWTLDRLKDKSELIQNLDLANPLAVAMESCRALVSGTPGPGIAWVTAFMVATFVASAAGFAFFQPTKDGFADVL